jgi:hypothetical protein
MEHQLRMPPVAENHKKTESKSSILHLEWDATTCCLGVHAFDLARAKSKETGRTMVRKRTIARYIVLTFTGFTGWYKKERQVFISL